MTNEQLAAMKALEEKATKGPWHVASAGIAHCPELGFVPDENRERSANRQFIAAARSFVPAAIAEIERLRGLVQEAYYEGCRDAATSRINSWDESEAKRALEQS